jgi:hypothetical protein
MTNDEISQIKILANRFRSAIESVDRAKLPISFLEFPRGSCGDTALLLYKYLSGHGHERFVYVCGLRDDYSHGWLKRGDLIVDITGDQFPDNNQRICVMRNSTWHSQFEIDDESSADFDDYDAYTRGSLRSAFAAILKHLGE